ncbi:PilZ domain-containing protein [Govanella unica]|uniref:PilZ domain-containing protein n=1 Tax=Govanella unica TaxID=2975056 RepID=A0A9X3U086_9PROT|nr:PilZ domain-containing protein [Govania unica]MDA5194544.1 hypothetical protein [Govania unica]
MKHYEELSGGEGRRIFFRAERFRARDLFQRSMPTLMLDQMPITLSDVSLSGLSAISAANSNHAYEPEKRVNIQLLLGNSHLYEGAGEVVRVEPTQAGTKLGLRLLDRSFNVLQVVDKYKEISLRNELASFAATAPGAGVAPEYRMLCADILQLLRSYRSGLDTISQTNLTPDAAAELLASCEQQIIPQWRELWYRGNALVEGIMDNPEALRATKKFTELVLTPEFMSGVVWNRSYAKPLGYPGDYQIMNMVYDWQRVGASLYEKLVHRIGLDVAECIATRSVMMRQEIAKTLLEKADGVARITNLGCGSAREVIDYLKLGQLPRNAQFTLIDQDQGALELVYESTHAEVIRLNRQASVRCLHASFSQLLKTQELFSTIGLQDFVYSVGLIDYLTARRAKAWITSLYKFIAPGGKLIISNMMKCPESNLWPMEFLTDWNIIYRDEQEMLALAAGLEDAEVSTSLDPTGRVVLLSMHKKA